ncbi:MAG: EamA/RhaT family transporter [Saprospirales bacterium]|nr:MAG: EamA/RhaT family transporter [Saprospirales bacterium]
MISAEKKAYIELHIAVFLFGFTAILGDLITLSAIELVWYRVLIAGISFLFFFRVRNSLKKLPRELVIKYLLIGAIAALHWVTFFGAIKLANASVALICLATTSFMTSIMEPIIVKRPFYWYESALSVLIIPGMVLIVQSLDSAFYLGMVVGFISAFLAATFGILNKKLIRRSDPLTISAIEMGGAWLFLSIILPVLYLAGGEMNLRPEPMDWLYLLVLALLCTTLAYALSLKALNHLSAFATALTINLEPIYGILLAIVILQDHHDLSTQFYLGGSMILLAVFSYPLIHKWHRKRQSG